MSAQTDVDFVLFYIPYIMVFASEEEGMFVFGRVLSLVGLVILFGLEVHFVDEDIETYMRKHDFTLK